MGRAPARRGEGLEPWAMGPKPWALGPEPWALGPGPWAQGPGLWALGPGPWALGLWPLALGPGPRVNVSIHVLASFALMGDYFKRIYELRYKLM